MRRFLARLALSLALILIALVAVLIAVGFFFVALYLWLKTLLIPPVAAAVCGFLILIFAAIVALISRGTMRRHRRPRRQDLTAEAHETAALLGGLMGRRAQRFMEANTATSLLTVLIAGFAVGISPKLRALLLSLLKG